MSKTKETLSFYYKTQTKTTKGTRLTLDLGKMMDLASLLVCAVSESRENERIIFLS